MSDDLYAHLLADFAKARSIRKQSTESDQEIYAFWDAQDVLFAETTLTGFVHHVNAAWERHLGWSPDRTKMMFFSTLIHPDDVNLLRDAMVDMSTHPIPRVRARVRMSSGMYKIVDWSVTQWSPPPSFAFNMGVIVGDASD